MTIEIFGEFKKPAESNEIILESIKIFQEKAKLDKLPNSKVAFVVPEGSLGGDGSDSAADRRAQLRGELLLENSGMERSYWFLFVSSIDRRDDINLIKEILFWSQLYHNKDAKIEILFPGNGTEGRYSFMRRTFNVSNLPTLIMTDKPIHKYPQYHRQN